MNNKPLTDHETQRLIRKMYEGEIAEHEMERLLHHFQSMESIPQKWKADAIMVRTLAVKAYCTKTQKDFDRKMGRLMQTPKPIQRKLFWTSHPRYAYCIMAILMVGCLFFWNIIAPPRAAATPHCSDQMVLYCTTDYSSNRVLEILHQTLKVNRTINDLETINTIMA